MTTPTNDMRIYALGTSQAYGERIARRLGMSPAAHEEREFDDGEHKARPLENVRGKDVFVIHSLYDDDAQSVNDKLCRLLFFLGAVRDAAAGRVTAVVPYLCYARKDRKTKFRDPVTTRYVAGMFEAVGVDSVVTLDVHNLAAFQNAFRCATEHLEARMLFVDHFAKRLRDLDVIVVSPDEGGIKRADAFRRALSQEMKRDLPLGFMEKRRSRDVVSGRGLFADVKDRTVVIIDDLIGTGTTLLRTAAAAREAGAIEVHAAASHGLFVGQAGRVFADPAFDSVVVTDTVPPFRLERDLIEKQIIVLDSTALVADAIRLMHDGGSVTALLGPED